MATDFRIALEELLDKSGADADFLREALRAAASGLMELEVSSKLVPSVTSGRRSA